jgi:hypothetical protein
MSRANLVVLVIGLLLLSGSRQAVAQEVDASQAVNGTWKVNGFMNTTAKSGPFESTVDWSFDGQVLRIGNDVYTDVKVSGHIIQGRLWHQSINTTALTTIYFKSYDSAFVRQGLSGDVMGIIESECTRVR